MSKYPFRPQPAHRAQLIELLEKLLQEEYSHVAVLFHSSPANQALFRSLYGIAKDTKCEINWTRKTWKKGNCTVRFLTLRDQDSVLDLSGFQFTHIISQRPNGPIQHRAHEMLITRIQYPTKYTPKMNAGMYYVGQ